MGRLQAFLCAVLLLLVLVLNHEVQADTPCTRECADICKKWGNLEFACYILCIDACETDPPMAVSTKQGLQQQTPEMEAKVRQIENERTNTPASKLHEDSEHLTKAPEASRNIINRT